MDSLPIPDELLVDIFLRVPNPADLIRVHATCASFRRFIADRSFLRRLRRLQPPPLLCLLDKKQIFHPVAPPHPFTPAASAAALAADFSFLPDPAHDWVVQDIRDGRVLLDSVPQDQINGSIFTELVVCDPLHRRYLLLHPVPKDLAASVEDPFPLESQFWPEALLVPPGDEKEAAAADETSFKVVFMAQCKFKMFAFVFSSSTGEWRAIPSHKWSDFTVRWFKSTWTRHFNSRQYAYGCFYWMTYFYRKDWMANCKEEIKMLVLDTAKLEFSIAEPPPEAAKDTSILGITIVEAGEGRLGMFVLRHGTLELSYTIRRYNGGSSNQCQTEKSEDNRIAYYVLVIRFMGEEVLVPVSVRMLIARAILFHAGHQNIPD